MRTQFSREFRRGGGGGRGMHNEFNSGGGAPTGGGFGGEFNAVNSQWFTNESGFCSSKRKRFAEKRVGR